MNKQNTDKERERKSEWERECLRENINRNSQENRDKQNTEKERDIWKKIGTNKT